MEMISAWLVVTVVAFSLGILAGVGVSWSAMIRRVDMVSLQVSRATHAAYEAARVEVDTAGDTPDRVSSPPEGRRVTKPVRQVPPDH